MQNPSLFVLRIFGPILILTGLLGFVTPPKLALMSGSAAYNIFHIAFGVLGVLVVSRRSEQLAAQALFVFGLIDAYQAIASFAGWFPEELFRWTLIDDILHVLLGVGLVAVATYSFGRQRR